MDKSIAVIGAGSWGTALALVLARNGHQVKMWGRDDKQLALMARDRSNERYLPGIPFPPKLTISKTVAEVLQGVRDVLIVVPSEAFRAALEEIKPLLPKNARIVWATKGLDPSSSLLLHQVAKEVLGLNYPLAVLTGPSFAKEVAEGLPTAVTLASTDPTFSKDLVAYFHSPMFRIYLNSDFIGVEVGGAVKNVLAVAAGISDGLGFGANTRAALITRGLFEMMRLGVALGAKQETFMGLAGVGDLVLTCTDNLSRNRRYGLALGQGLTPSEAQKSIGQVIEALANTALIYDLACKLNIEMPIVEQVYRVLSGELTPKAAVHALMSREPKLEGRV